MKFLLVFLVTIAVITAEIQLSIEQAASEEVNILINSFRENDQKTNNLFKHMISKRNVKMMHYFDYFINKTISFVEDFKSESCEEDTDNLRLWDVIPITFKRYFLMLINEYRLNDLKWDHLKPEVQEKLLSIKNIIKEKKSILMKNINYIFSGVLSEKNFDVCLDKSELKKKIMDLVDSEFDNQLKSLVNSEAKPCPIFGFDLIKIAMSLIFY